MSAGEAYAELRALARRDPNVIGLFLGGSRGKGIATEHSDYDVYLIVRRKVNEYRRKFPLRHGDDPEIIVFSLAEFRRHAAVGSDSEWNRYTFAHVTVEFDKTGGEIQKLVDEKGELPREAARSIAADALDGYINQYYRSAKNFRDGDDLAGRLDATESVPYFLTALFALHGRVRPFNKYLRFELERYPLPGPSWNSDRLLPMLEDATAGDLAAQATLFRALEALARERGHGDVVDAWGDDVAWLRNGATGSVPRSPRAGRRGSAA